VRHGGTLAGFRSQFMRFVDDGLTIIVLANSGNARPEVIARGVASLYLPDLSPSETK
jgi:hypothetical protein